MPTNRKAAKRDKKSAAEKAQFQLPPQFVSELNAVAEANAKEKSARAEKEPAPETYIPSPDDPDATVPATRAELGASIFGKRNVAQVLSDLMQGHGDPKQAANRLRACHLVLDIFFGKAGADNSSDAPPHADWDGIPGPDREIP
jgi:hypothetical protein